MHFRQSHLSFEPLSSIFGLLESRLFQFVPLLCFFSHNYIALGLAQGLFYDPLLRVCYDNFLVEEINVITNSLVREDLCFLTIAKRTFYD